MLHEEQIDIRRQRAREGKFQIENIGKNRVFSDYRVTNPQSGGQYTVGIRGFDVGDNTCTCPDFRSNTLGTCKHVEAVLDTLRDEKTTVRQKKAVVTRPEVTLHYREQLRLRIQIPARHSDALEQLTRKFFDAQGFWNNTSTYDELIAAIEQVPEQVTVMSDAMEFIDRELERRDMAQPGTGMARRTGKVGRGFAAAAFAQSSSVRFSDSGRSVHGLSGSLYPRR